MRTFLHGLFARLGPPADGGPGDDQLLAAYLASRDEAGNHVRVRLVDGFISCVKCRRRGSHMRTISRVVPSWSSTRTFAPRRAASCR